MQHPEVPARRRQIERLANGRNSGRRKKKRSVASVDVCEKNPFI